MIKHDTSKARLLLIQLDRVLLYTSSSICPLFQIIDPKIMKQVTL